MKNFALFQNSRWTNTILEPPNSPFLKEGKGDFRPVARSHKILSPFHGFAIENSIFIYSTNKEEIYTNVC